MRVAAGTDPVTKQRHRLTEIIPAGPLAEDEAEKALRRLLVQVDEKVNPRTAATVAQLLEKHFALLEVERTTRATYENLARTHIVPVIGKVKLAALSSQIFDSFYALLRRCRLHCKGQRMIEHRVKGKHDCDHRCRRHVCKPLAQSTIRQIHVILSGALRRAVRWRWLSRNPIEHAEPPKQPAANPQPPTSAEAARILNASWDDPDWAVLVWLTMVTGARRGELCTLRWDDVDLLTGTLRVQRSIAELLRHRPSRAGPRVMRRDPPGDEPHDMGGQLRNRPRSVSMSELAERERDRHPTPDALDAVTLPDKPAGIGLDIGPDPRAPEPIERRRLGEVPLQHGRSALLRVRNGPTTMPPTPPVMWPQTEQPDPLHRPTWTPAPAATLRADHASGSGLYQRSLAPADHGDNTPPDHQRQGRKVMPWPVACKPSPGLIKKVTGGAGR
ncbi:hypothetical protein GCM10023175_52200 [Pseudonocardia xishanensis]|uniref:Phage integrase family protein n=1 Tax=Pseudonocardia xishanensis TaxID=630995 RepID=A0ABP8RY87_9PSEU